MRAGWLASVVLGAALALGVSASARAQSCGLEGDSLLGQACGMSPSAAALPPKPQAACTARPQAKHSSSAAGEETACEVAATNDDEEGAAPVPAAPGIVLPLGPLKRLDEQPSLPPLPPLAPRFAIPAASVGSASLVFEGGALLDDAALLNGLAQAFGRPILRGIKVGLVVSDAASGAVLLERNGREPFNPASVSKLITTIGALRVFGPGYRFVTPILTDGSFESDGTLRGTLIVQGQGDPFLVVEQLHRLAAELYLKGLRRVEGDLLIDQSFFDKTAKPQGFDQDGSEHAYQAPTSAFAVNFNSIEMNVLPGPIGQAPRAAFVPFTPYVALRNEAKTVKSGRTRLSVVRQATKDGLLFILRGQMRADYEGTSYYLRVPEPGPFCGAALLDALKRVGIKVSGKARVGAVPAGAKPFTRFLSPFISELVAETNKWSNNLMAEELLKGIGARIYGAPGSFDKGTAVAKAVVEELVAYPRAAYTFRNGSGLGDANRIPPELFARLLVNMANNPQIGPELLASLAIGGSDGTLRRLFVDSDAAYKLRGKTGSLNDVFAMAGLLLTKSGRQVAVVLEFEGIKDLKGKERQEMRKSFREIILLLADWDLKL